MQVPGQRQECPFNPGHGPGPAVMTRLAGAASGGGPRQSSPCCADWRACSRSSIPLAGPGARGCSPTAGGGGGQQLPGSRAGSELGREAGSPPPRTQGSPGGCSPVPAPSLSLALTPIGPYRASLPSSRSLPFLP